MDKPESKPKVPEVEFVVSKKYDGPRSVGASVKLYSRNTLLKVVGFRTSRYMFVDIDKGEIKFAEEKHHEKVAPTNCLPFDNITSIKLDLKKAHKSCYYIIITLEDKTTFKIKFLSLIEFQKIVEVLRGIETHDGHPFIKVGHKYLHLNEPEHTHDDEISSEEEESEFHPNKTHHLGEVVQRGFYEDPAEVIRKQEHDDEYAYLKWKFIDKFEKSGSTLPPENLMEYYYLEHGGKPKVAAKDSSKLNTGGDDHHNKPGPAEGH